MSDSDSDGKIPDATPVSITPFRDDQMFQRWLLDRIHQRHEMEFERGALPSVVGFLTGMDDQFYSVSTSDFPPKSRILPRASVTMISETNRSLHELDDERVEVRIKRYTARIHRACAEQLIPAQRIRSVRPTQQSV